MQLLFFSLKFGLGGLRILSDAYSTGTAGLLSEPFFRNEGTSKHLEAESSDASNYGHPAYNIGFTKYREQAPIKMGLKRQTRPRASEPGNRKKKD